MPGTRMANPCPACGANGTHICPYAPPISICAKCGQTVHGGQLHICSAQAPMDEWHQQLTKENQRRIQEQMEKMALEFKRQQDPLNQAILSRSLASAAQRAKDSEIAFIRLQIEEDGVVVIAECGGKQGEIKVLWERLGRLTKDELIDAIETLEADME